MSRSSLKYSFTFLLLSAICILFAISYDSIISTVVLIPVASAFAMIAGIYVIREPKLMGKRSDGHTTLLAIALLFPFRLFNSFALWLFRVTENAPPWAEVIPNLLLGRKLTTQEANQLPVTRVLDLTSEFNECRSLRNREYFCVPMLDGLTPSLAQLDQAVSWLRSSVKQGQTYVHCALGHSRSATVVVAYLLLEQQVNSLNNAITLVQSVRPGVRLSRAQRKTITRLLQKQAKGSEVSAQ